MKTCVVTLKSVSPYSQSRMHNEPHLNKEGHGEYERRTWKNKAHVKTDGLIFLPPMAFKQAVDASAKFLGIPVPGKGKSLYTKHFLSGVLVIDGLTTETHIDDVEEEWINANSDGVRGSGKRVPRCFPTIPSWQGKVSFHVVDDTITEEVFETVLEEAGKFIGVGRFRPEKGGFYGRFEVVDFEWQ